MDDQVPKSGQRVEREGSHLLAHPRTVTSFRDTHASGNAFVHNGDNHGTHHHHYPSQETRGEPSDEEVILKALLRSLTFERMDARLRNVLAPLPRTCKWLFQHPQFQAWLDPARLGEHGGFLWIKGKPGCGKSTIMKETLAEVGKSQWVVVHYFFNARASGKLEKSCLGLYRSLTHQILAAIPDLRESFLKDFHIKFRDRIVEDWTEAELQDFLLRSVQNCNVRLCILIDALDEGHEDDIRQMIYFLENLTAQACASQQALRICLSSRHYPYITIRRGLSIVVEDEERHNNDIKIYVRDRLSGIEDERSEDLVQSICRKSNSIFLWVALVVPILSQTYDQGRAIETLFKKLDEIPEDLNGLFKEIINRSDKDVNECVLLLQWVLYAFSPLSPAALYLAIQYSRHDIQALPLTTGTLPSRNHLRRYLLNCSRGLVEYTKIDPVVIQFIHETVRDFLLPADETNCQGKGLCQFAPSLSPNVSGYSHDTLKSTCHRYLRCSPIPAELRRPIGAASSVDTSAFERAAPLVVYAARNFLHHAELAQENGVEQYHFLEEVGMHYCNYVAEPSVLEWVDAVGQLSSIQSRRGETILHLMAYIEGKHLVETFLAQAPKSIIDSMINKKADASGTALHIACSLRNEHIASRLLEYGAAVHVEDAEGQTPLDISCREKDRRLVVLLLQNKRRGHGKRLDETLRTQISKGTLEHIQFALDITGLSWAARQTRPSSCGGTRDSTPF